MAAMEKSSAPSEAIKDAKTVLIVEDNDLNMKLFHDLLEVHGYRVIEARNGAEAIARARSDAPDLILMDIQLPEISGLKATQEIQADPLIKETPIVAVTAYATRGDEERILAGGCRDYIAKPISVADFLEKVKRYLD
ncbi:MAG: response regulator [Parvularculaceae bacterium]|nr:MAG: response regulator [Parvularculaceae bacterium]